MKGYPLVRPLDVKKRSQNQVELVRRLDEGERSQSRCQWYWGEAMSFNEVGEQMRVSAEYGRRLCAGALKKLTKAVEEGHLDPAMLF